jgi:hypothetical protein
MASQNHAMLEIPDAVSEAIAGIDELLLNRDGTLTRAVAGELQRIRNLLGAVLHTGARQPTSPQDRTPGINERRYPRIEYPQFVGPRLVIEAREYEVTDCAIEGVRFRLSDQPALETGRSVKGCIHFWSGNTVTISGTVVRAEDGVVALYLTGMPIPGWVIDAEERFLRLNYPPETYRRWQISAQIALQPTQA